MVKTTNFLDLIIERDYVSLFRAFVAFLTLYLATLVHAATFIAPIDVDAYKLKFTVEKELGRELDFQNLECRFEMKTFEDCKLAQHKYALSEAGQNLLDKIHYLLYLLMLFTAPPSLIGYFWNLKKNEQDEKKTN